MAQPMTERISGQQDTEARSAPAGEGVFKALRLATLRLHGEA